MTSDRQADIDAAFERLFNGYQRPIFNYVYRLLGDAARAEELTQDVFVKAYRALPRLPTDANHRAWLYRIATNAAYDQLRRRRLIQWLPLAERDRSSTLDNDVEGKLGESDAVQSALAKLPARHRAVLILFSVQGYSTREIGNMMGISSGAVKTRLYRARERFRQVYGEDA